MLSLLTGLGTPLPIEQSVIDSITKEPPAIVQTVAPVELTLQQKIDTNHYKCNTDLEWIWASDATCHPKQVQSTTRTQSTVKQPRNGSTGLNGYYVGQCTGHVASLRYVPAGWGDATNWGYAASSAGWTVSNTPVAGAIAWRSGHVAFVISVGAGTVLISEQNYDYNGSIRTINVPTNSYKYIY